MIVKNGRHSSVLLRIRVGLRAHREVLFGARFLDGSEQGNAADDENPEREYPDTRSGFGQKSRQENQPPAQNDEEQKRRDEINNETERFSDLKRKRIASAPAATKKASVNCSRETGFPKIGLPEG